MRNTTNVSRGAPDETAWLTVELCCSSPALGARSQRPYVGLECKVRATLANSAIGIDRLAHARCYGVRPLGTPLGKRF